MRIFPPPSPGATTLSYSNDNDSKGNLIPPLPVQANSASGEGPTHQLQELDSNVVRIGKKPTMNYVVACVTLFNSGKPNVLVRARGQSITKAVDTVELLRRAFISGLQVKSIDIGTDRVKGYDGQETSLSCIEILLGKH